MGAAAGPIIGALIGVGGGILSANKQKKAAEKIAGTAGNVAIPGDIRDLRAKLSTFFQGGANKGFGLFSPNVNELQQNLLYFASPEFFRQQTESFDPNSIIQDMISASLPGFRNDLDDILGGIGSRFSAQGNRFSSDLARTQAKVGSRSIQDFQAGFQNLMPQLLQTQIAAQSLIPSLIAGQATGLNALFQPSLAMMNAASGFGTAGVGGSAAINPALLSGLGQSGLAAGLIQGGEAIPGIAKVIQNAQTPKTPGGP